MSTTASLREFIDTHAVACDLIELPAAGESVAAAASALGVDAQAIVKSVLFIANDAAVLAIASGEARIEVRHLAAALDISKKRIRLASPEQTLAWTGYPAGGVPPFGHPTPLRTFVDPAVLAQGVVYAGAGSARLVMRISPAELVRIASARVLPIS